MEDFMLELQEKLGKEKAEELIKSIKLCDQYIIKFRNKITPILDLLDQEVKIGMLFIEKQKEG